MRCDRLFVCYVWRHKHRISPQPVQWRRSIKLCIFYAFRVKSHQSHQRNFDRPHCIPLHGPTCYFLSVNELMAFLNKLLSNRMDIPKTVNCCLHLIQLAAYTFNFLTIIFISQMSGFISPRGSCSELSLPWENQSAGPIAKLIN